MKIHEATEQAYKNGYDKGYEDGRPKWIPVTDRLPEEGKEVLALSPEYEEYQIGWLAKCEEEQCGVVCVGDGIELYKVTHWMPLPEPPKGE